MSNNNFQEWRKQLEHRKAAYDIPMPLSDGTTGPTIRFYLDWLTYPLATDGPAAHSDPHATTIMFDYNGLTYSGLVKGHVPDDNESIMLVCLKHFRAAESGSWPNLPEIIVTDDNH